MINQSTFFPKYMVIKEKQTGHLFKIWIKLRKAFSPLSWSGVLVGMWGSVFSKISTMNTNFLKKKKCFC